MNIPKCSHCPSNGVPWGVIVEAPKGSSNGLHLRQRCRFLSGNDIRCAKCRAQLHGTATLSVPSSLQPICMTLRSHLMHVEAFKIQAAETVHQGSPFRADGINFASRRGGRIECQLDWFPVDGTFRLPAQQALFDTDTGTALEVLAYALANCGLVVIESPRYPTPERLGTIRFRSLIPIETVDSEVVQQLLVRTQLTWGANGR